VGEDDWKNTGDEDGTPAPFLDRDDPLGDEGGCCTGVDVTDLRDECPLLRRDEGVDMLFANR
jgi:hypothetical protein